MTLKQGDYVYAEGTYYKVLEVREVNLWNDSEQCPDTGYRIEMFSLQFKHSISWLYRINVAAKLSRKAGAKISRLYG